MREELADYEEKDVKKVVTQATTATFNDFLLKKELIQVLKEIRFEHPSEVQQEAIPKSIMGVDVLCQAKSGMGKTAVFIISCLQQLEVLEGEIQVLVLVNTKEMVHQIYEEFLRFSKHFKGIKIGSFSGGTPLEQDIENLKVFPNIFIGTPGRTLDLIRRKEVSLRHLKHFVLDEADQMLQDLQGRWQVQQIFMFSNPKKQTLLFSATFNEYTRKEGEKFLKNPHKIIIGDENKLIIHGLKQFYLKVSSTDPLNNKLNQLEGVLDSFDFNQCIIFVKEKNQAEYLNNNLIKNAFPSIVIHSSLSPNERKERCDSFKKLKFRILVTTNLFSRGVDIQDINFVINYDMPESTETYLHRVGRAARFDTKGTAISFIQDERDVVMLNEVQKRFDVEIKELVL